MSKVKRLTQKEFDLAKILLTNGMKNVKVQEIIGRSYATVNFVGQASDFDDYHKVVTEYWKTHGPKKKPKQMLTPEVQPEVKSEEPSRFMDGHNSMVTVLKAIEYNQTIEIELQKEEIKILKEFIANKPWWLKKLG